MIYLPITRHTPSSNNHRQENILPAVGMFFTFCMIKGFTKVAFFFFYIYHIQFKDRKLKLTPTSPVHASVMF